MALDQGASPATLPVAGALGVEAGAGTLQRDGGPDTVIELNAFGWAILRPSPWTPLPVEVRTSPPRPTAADQVTSAEVVAGVHLLPHQPFLQDLRGMEPRHHNGDRITWCGWSSCPRIASAPWSPLRCASDCSR